MMRCPSNVGANTAKLADEGHSYAVGQSLNGRLLPHPVTGLPQGPLPMKLPRVKNSSQKIMVFESDTPTTTWGNSFDMCGNRSARNWHNRASNFLMCDNSVQRMRDSWLDYNKTAASTTVDGSTETKRFWFRTTQSTAAYNTGNFDRLWR